MAVSLRPAHLADCSDPSASSRSAAASPRQPLCPRVGWPMPAPAPSAAPPIAPGCAARLADTLAGSGVLQAATQPGRPLKEKKKDPPDLKEKKGNREKERKWTAGAGPAVWLPGRLKPGWLEPDLLIRLPIRLVPHGLQHPSPPAPIDKNVSIFRYVSVSRCLRWIRPKDTRGLPPDRKSVV